MFLEMSLKEKVSYYDTTSAPSNLTKYENYLFCKDAHGLKVSS